MEPETVRLYAIYRDYRRGVNASPKIVSVEAKKVGSDIYQTTEREPCFFGGPGNVWVLDNLVQLSVGALKAVHLESLCKSINHSMNSIENARKQLREIINLHDA